METCTWSMIVTFLGIMIAIAGALGGFILWAFSKLDGDIKGMGTKLENMGTKLDGDIKSLSLKIDAQINSQAARIDAQSKRTDQLYQMFIDLLKSQNPKTNP